MSDSEGFSEQMETDDRAETGIIDDDEERSNSEHNPENRKVKEHQRKGDNSLDSDNEEDMTEARRNTNISPDLLSKSNNDILPFRMKTDDQKKSIQGTRRNNIIFCEDGEYKVLNPSLDLETYAQRYSGRAQLLRLHFISNHCPSLQVEALIYAVQNLRLTFNTRDFGVLQKRLDYYQSGKSIEEPLSSSAKEWTINQDKKALAKLHKLEDEIKVAKNSSMKESLWQGCNDLGDHYLDCGDQNNALRSYSQGKDHCTSGRQLIKTCTNVVKAASLVANWGYVVQFANKALSLPEFGHNAMENMSKAQSMEIQATQTRMFCAIGLAELANSKYRNAAMKFIASSFDHCDSPDLISPNDVAIYGSLCAMASFNRTELQQKVVKSASFKSFLELDPPLRKILSTFHASKYGESLRLLEEMKETLLCDYQLARHVDTLFELIKRKAMVQYFSPYSSADLNAMSSAFNLSVPQLENELMSLILDGQIQAKIDSHNKLLISKNVDKRNEVYSRVVQMSEEYERREKMLLFRASVVKHDIEIKSNNSMRGRFGGLGNFGYNYFG